MPRSRTTLFVHVAAAWVGIALVFVSALVPLRAVEAAPLGVITPDAAGHISRAGGVAPLYPAGGDTAPNGKRYVADSGRSRIVTITANGRQHVVRNRGSDWRDPRDLTVDSGNARKLWVLDTGNDRVVRLDTVHGDHEKEFGEPGDPQVTLTEPYGVSDDNSGLYVADTYYANGADLGRVVKLAKGSGSILWQKSEGCGSPFGRPRDVAVGSNGDLYVADTDNDRIVRLDRGNGDCVDEFGNTGPGALDAPRSLAATSGGLWISEGQAARVQRFRNNGAYVQGSSFGSFGTGRNRFRSPHCVFMDGRLLAVCDTFNFRIQRLRVTGGNPRYHSTLGGTRPANGGFNEPWDAAFGPGGVLYVTDSFNHRIEKFDAQGDFVKAWGGYGSRNGSFTFPRGIAVDGNRVVVTDSENNRIDLFSLSGTFLDSIKPVGAGNAFSRPHQTAVAGDGSYWVADTLNDRAVHLDVGGAVLHEIPGVSRARGIAVDGPDIYVAYGTGNQSVVQRYNASGTPQGPPVASFGSADGQVQGPYGLRIATIHGQPVLLVADRGNNRVQIFDLATGDFVDSLSGGLTQPQGMDARNNGRIAVANFGRNRVSLWNS